MGAGSGLLAIAAAKLGIKHVLAIDNDPDAVDACRKNAAINSVSILTRIFHESTQAEVIGKLSVLRGRLI